MKKISIILAAASVLVVGGVYAGWSYSQGAVAATDDDIGVIMTDESTSSAKGILSVDSSASKFEIDDGGDYLPTLLMKNSPVVTFTPNAGVDDDVKANGIDIEWWIEIHQDEAHPGDWQYDTTFGSGTAVMKDIFTVNTAKTAITTPDTGTSFKYTIPTSEILAKVTLTLNAEGVKLDTKAKFQSFKHNLMDGHHFTLHVQEKI